MVDLKLFFEFVKDGSGNIQKIITKRSGSIESSKISSATDSSSFTDICLVPRADLHCRYPAWNANPMRTCYDVLFYDLDVTVDRKQNHQGIILSDLKQFSLR